ncbi:MAG: hypothetical protein F6K62_22000, partial [Sphaerospermopsis sp. SIO1G2]|nr:hypothetical protein [Sphaerospermopsis sp. SIO1G2]
MSSEELQSLRQHNSDLEEQIGQFQAEVANAQQDLTELRRKMAQQLTRISALVNALRDIDADFFGERFFATAEGDNFFADLDIAEDVVDALADQLAGKTSFTDSPLIRDAIRHLRRQVVALRDQAAQLDEHGAVAIGMPDQTYQFADISAPNDNSIKQLQLLSSQIAAIDEVCRQAIGRIDGLRAMAQQADQAVADLGADPTAVAEVARAELARVEAEHQDLEEAFKRFQQQQEDDKAQAHEHTRALRRKLDRAAQDKQDLEAEWASTAMELCRLAKPLVGSDYAKEMAAVEANCKQSPGQLPGSVENVIASVFQSLTERLDIAQDHQQLLDDRQRHINQLNQQLATAEETLQQVQQQQATAEQAESRIEALTEQLSEADEAANASVERLLVAEEAQATAQQRLAAAQATEQTLQRQCQALTAELEQAKQTSTTNDEVHQELQQRLADMTQQHKALNDTLRDTQQAHDELQQR